MTPAFLAMKMAFRSDARRGGAGLGQEARLVEGPISRRFYRDT